MSRRHRRRRPERMSAGLTRGGGAVLLIAVLATSLVFALTLLLSGAGHGLRSEAKRATDTFGADAWFVPKGTSGPFTASSVIAATSADQVAKVPGVQRADPFVY